jgi:hypothetical protein
MRHPVADVVGGLHAHAADLRVYIVQSGIDNHRTALWTQVRTAFRSNINETDEDKVGVLVSRCRHRRLSLLGALPARTLCTPGDVPACRSTSRRMRKCAVKLCAHMLCSACDACILHMAPMLAHAPAVQSVDCQTTCFSRRSAWPRCRGCALRLVFGEAGCCNAYRSEGPMVRKGGASMCRRMRQRA